MQRPFESLQVRRLDAEIMVMGRSTEAAQPRRETRLRAVFSDPPMLDRLAWREGISAQTLISEDRGLIARAFGTLYVAGSAIGFLILALGEPLEHGREVVFTLSSIALLLGVICFIGYRRLPRWFFTANLTLGSLMITGAAASAADGAESIYGFFYIWVVIMAFLFFPIKAAAAQAVFAAVAYGAVLIVGDPPYATSILLAAGATIGTTGLLIGFVRSHTERMATGLASEAHTDPITGLMNRRGFDQRFEREVDQARRTHRPLSLVICDLDRFKAVNDELGHEEGDLALRRTAVAIVEATRAADVVARLGGEEFAVLLPDTDGRGAYSVAERIRDSVRVEFDGFPVKLTTSCGVASLAVGADHEVLYRHADAALYSAKEAGRNRTEAHEQNTVPLRLLPGRTGV